MLRALLVGVALLASSLVAASPPGFPTLSNQFSMRINMTKSTGEYLGVETVASDHEHYQLHIQVRCA